MGRDRYNEHFPISRKQQYLQNLPLLLGIYDIQLPLELGTTLTGIRADTNHHTNLTSAGKNNPLLISTDRNHPTRLTSTGRNHSTKLSSTGKNNPLLKSVLRNHLKALNVEWWLSGTFGLVVRCTVQLNNTGTH